MLNIERSTIRELYNDRFASYRAASEVAQRVSEVHSSAYRLLTWLSSLDKDQIAATPKDVDQRSADLVTSTGSGNSTVRVDLIRTSIHNANIVLDHGFGQVHLDGNHISNVTDTFVNNGSNAVFSLGNNWVTNFTNATPGSAYITPSIIAPM